VDENMRGLQGAIVEDASMADGSLPLRLGVGRLASAPDGKPALAVH
jgi:hypothetical protein